jgi:hypothetical protein
MQLQACAIGRPAAMRRSHGTAPGTPRSAGWLSDTPAGVSDAGAGNGHVARAVMQGTKDARQVDLLGEQPQRARPNAKKLGRTLDWHARGMRAVAQSMATLICCCVGRQRPRSFFTSRRPA